MDSRDRAAIAFLTICAVALYIIWAADTLKQEVIGI